MKTHQAHVVNVVRASTKWGPRLCLNTKLEPSRTKVAIWSNDLNNPIFLDKKPGEIIELIEDPKTNKYSVLDREPQKSSPSSVRRSTSYTPKVSTKEVEHILDNDLDLPQQFSDADKVRLSKLIRERAKLLTHTIEIMRDELNDKGLEFHEGSIRSLSVSLFIHISRHLD